MAESGSLRSLRQAFTARRFLAVLVLVAALAAVDGFLVEPRWLLTRDHVELDLVPGRFRVVHLSDLHVRPERGIYDRLLRRVAAEEPDLILVSGDLVADVRQGDLLVERAREAAGWVARLRRIAPILAVQGHSEYRGEVVSLLAEAGVEWLSNEGRAIGPGGEGGRILLLGLNEQVGRDSDDVPPPAFRLVREADCDTCRERTLLRSSSRHRRNRYLSYDPRVVGAARPADLATEAGPFAWSGYDATVSVRVEDDGSGAGLVVHSQYALGENRAIRLARAKRSPDDSGHFALTFDGSAPAYEAEENRIDTGISPEAGRWYRLRLATEVHDDRVEVRAKVWPEDEAEPERWQAWATDRSERRVERGTVAFWTWGEGRASYRDLRVEEEGRTLLDAPMTGPAAELPAGFRDGARSTRLEMAQARSPVVPAGTPRVVLSHVPAAVVDAGREGMPLVLAGHTHGGQVRLPFFGALVTRSSIGRRYDRGLFEWPDAPDTLLYVNAGVGTSILPVRFFDPPVYAVFDF